MRVHGLTITCFLLLATPVSAEPVAGSATPETADVAEVQENVAPDASSAVATPDQKQTESEKSVPVSDSEMTPALAQELSRLKPQKESAGKKSQSSYLEMAVGLMAVLGVIVSLAWLARRFNVSGMSLSQSLKLHSVLSLGTKEKVVIVNVEGRRFLLGVTPHQINILSELDTDEPAAKGDLAADTSSFAQQIKNALKQGKLGEDSKAS